VFLLGFPRSGTTLLEVILEGHPDVISLEEKESLIDSVNEFMRRPEDLLRLIKMVRQEEAVSDDMYKEAAWRLRRQRLKKTDPADYARRIREVLLYADPMHWSSRSERYALIAERLEEIASEAGLIQEGRRG